MDLEECPLSKEELLELVEEEAAMRVSASFLEQVVGEGKRGELEKKIPSEMEVAPRYNC